MSIIEVYRSSVLCSTTAEKQWPSFESSSIREMVRGARKYTTGPCEGAGGLLAAAMPERCDICGVYCPAKALTLLRGAATGRAAHAGWGARRDKVADWVMTTRRECAPIDGRGLLPRQLLRPRRVAPMSHCLFIHASGEYLTEF